MPISGMRAIFGALGGDDLDPEPIWILDKVDAHALVDLHHATHLGVVRKRRGVIVHGKREVNVSAAVIIGLGAAEVPGELQLEVGLVVFQEDDLPRAVLRTLLADGLQTQGLLVERQRGVEVKNVHFRVDHLEIHGNTFLTQRKSARQKRAHK